MSVRYVTIDRETPMMFPVDMRDWLPKNHLVHFIIEVVEQISKSAFKVNKRGSGDEQYPPEMMLALLIYSYATGTFSSRRIEAATYSDIAVMYICAGKAHPDHSVICDFRVKNKEAFREAFTKVLLIACEMKQLKKVGGISVDGTKIHANASKHRAVSYKRAGEMIAELEGEVGELMKKAEDADSTPLEEGLTIPAEIGLREERKAALAFARGEMEKRYKEAKEEEALGREAGSEEGGKQDGKGAGAGKRADKTGEGTEQADEAQWGTAPDNYQYNFTDSESRIMKEGNGKHFEQDYNAQAAVDTEGSMLILGGYVTNHGNDKKELAPVVAGVDKEIRDVKNVSADTGYYSEEAIDGVEQRNAAGEQAGPEVYCAVEKGTHHRSVKDLEKKKAGRPPAGQTKKQKMGRKLKTKKGKAIYKKRKETVEPVFGIIKSVLGFRQFMLRGLKKVNTEWDLVMASYNFKKLHKMIHGIPMPKSPVMA
jgi:transposase